MWSKYPPKESPNYRQELDGLRAIAVLSVFAFHLRRSWLPGGFVGVDIFFVISGYVVSQSLASRSVRPAGAYLSDFYKRRLKRLLPALVVCCLFSAVLVSRATPPMPPEFSIGSYRTAIMALVGLSNFYLIRLTGSYFDGDVLPNPFLHTWSLAVEEQFYLVVPLLFCLCFSPGAPVRTDRVRLMLVSLLSLGSLWLSASWVTEPPGWGYYAMPSRFWELGAGCAVAFAERLGYFDGLARRAWLSRVGTAAAMALIIAAVVFTEETAFPFPGALPAVIGTAALLITSRGARSPLVALLASTPVTYVGRLSYSIYLWHWPFVTVAIRTVGLHDAWGIALVVVATGIASVASHHLVELPLRYAPVKRAWPVFAAAATLVIMAAATIETIQRRRNDLFAGVRQDWSHDWTIPANEPLVATGQITKTECHLSHGAELPASVEGPCLAPAQGQVSRRLFAFGDSHSNANWPMLKAGVDAGLYNLFALSHDACEVRTGPPAQGESCDRFWPHIRQIITREARPGDLVMLSASIRPYEMSEQVEREMRGLIRATRSQGATFILQSPVPKHNKRAFDCLPAWFVRRSPGCRTSKAEDQRRARAHIQFVQRMAREEPGVVVWDAYDLLFPSETFGHFRDGKPVFRDDDHLAAWGARLLGPHFVKFIREQALRERRSEDNETLTSERNACGAIAARSAACAENVRSASAPGSP